MCQILIIDPNVVIPPNLLDITCDINKHGYGISFVKKGRLQYIYNADVNDPKDVADQLQKLRSHRVFLHLRHATVGAINSDNAHPFIILDHKKHGLDMGLMHNGTLHDWTPKDVTDTHSDTWHLVEKYVRPLAHRIKSYGGAKNVLFDDIFQKCLIKEAGYSSVIVLMDNNEKYLVINEARGKKYDGFWASNEYSFQRSHHRSSWTPSTSVPQVSRPWKGALSELPDDNQMPWQEDRTSEADFMMKNWEDELGKQEIPVQTVKQIVDKSKSNNMYNLVGEMTRLRTQDEGVIIVQKNGILVNTKASRKTFVELAKLTSLDQTHNLTESDLKEIAKTYPEAAASLIIDLMADRAKLKMTNATQAQTILDLQKPMVPAKENPGAVVV